MMLAPLQIDGGALTVKAALNNNGQTCIHSHLFHRHKSQVCSPLAVAAGNGVSWSGRGLGSPRLGLVGLTGGGGSGLRRKIEAMLTTVMKAHHH